jgi:hypothetical protein
MPLSVQRKDEPSALWFVSVLEGVVREFVAEAGSLLHSRGKNAPSKLCGMTNSIMRRNAFDEDCGCSVSGNVL